MIRTLVIIGLVMVSAVYFKNADAGFIGQYQDVIFAGIIAVIAKPLFERWCL
jgi:hypothetical protein